MLVFSPPNKLKKGHEAAMSEAESKFLPDFSACLSLCIATSKAIYFIFPKQFNMWYKLKITKVLGATSVKCKG